MTALSVNLNKIALIRNSRDTRFPDVVEHAGICVNAGADGITVHPRPDQRHIRAQDCYDLAQALNVEFNIEGNPFAPPHASERAGVSDYPGYLPLVREIRPTQCTLVPDTDNQLTSDHGFDLRRDAARVTPVIEELRSLGIRTSLFLDPDPEQVRLAADTGTDRIELYTESYARAFLENGDVEGELQRFIRAAETAAEVGLGVNAGHDLNLDNLPGFTRVSHLAEVSIGHALVIDALRMGLAAAVAAYLAALGR